MSYSITFRKVYLSGPSAGIEVYDSFRDYISHECAERRADVLRSMITRDMRSGELFKYCDVQVEEEQ